MRGNDGEVAATNIQIKVYEFADLKRELQKAGQSIEESRYLRIQRQDSHIQAVDVIY